MLNLDRTPWHMTWVGVRPQRARRRLDRARVSARTLPVERSWREERKKERKKTDNPREGWEDGTPPPHRDFKERGVMR